MDVMLKAQNGDRHEWHLVERIELKQTQCHFRECGYPGGVKQLDSHMRGNDGGLWLNRVSKNTPSPRRRPGSSAVGSI